MVKPELVRVRPTLLAFLPALPWIILITFVPVFLIALLLGRGLGGSVSAGVATLIGVAPVMFAIMLVCGHTYYVRVHEDGVSSYDPWGSWEQNFIAWHRMLDIRRVATLGVPYVRIESEAGNWLWIPERTFKHPSFIEAVQNAAPTSRLAGWIGHIA